MAGTRDLRQNALRMGALAESILGKAVRALRERDTVLAQRIESDDLEIDRLELELDEAILKELALRAHAPEELRLVIAVKSMIVDLERVGDLARNIARSASRLAGRAETPWTARLEWLEDGAMQLLHESLDCFQELDPDLARAVIAGDDEIDALQDSIVRELIAGIRERPDLAAQLVDLILIAENLERIADHATNIAEDVILVTEGRNVKHAGKLR
jgi:phosphate transport system protein